MEIVNNQYAMKLFQKYAILFDIQFAFTNGDKTFITRLGELRSKEIKQLVIFKTDDDVSTKDIKRAKVDIIHSDQNYVIFSIPTSEQESVPLYPGKDQNCVIMHCDSIQHQNHIRSAQLDQNIKDYIRQLENTVIEYTRISLKKE